MYLPRAFAETDLAALDDLLADDAFVTLVSVHDGAPTANHVPVLYRRDGERVELRGHVARANPLAHRGGRVLAIVHGPHAYVSPSWYPDKETAARVPTWNYAIAHLEGELQLFEDESALASIVDDLSRRYEASVGSDWRFEPARDDHRSQLRGITGFRIPVDRISLKFKLSQNHPLANQTAVAERLATQDRDASRRVATLMRTRIATTEG
jgi:transcriptional regulator